jgi:ubiquinone/menaquinone biosynthesis C-methylase UbiE
VNRLPPPPPSRERDSRHPSDDALRAYYAARAPYYDDVYQRPECRADVAFLERHLPERLRDRAVLEVACGTGWWTRLIAPAAARLVATDATAEPLALARARPGTARATFVQADAYALPESLGRFDAAFAGLWLSHVPIRRRPAFLASLHARLAPGARVVLLDNSVRQCVELPIAERDADGDTWQHRRLRDGSVHRVLKNFPTEDELRSMVDAVAARAEYRALGHFWLFEYELDAPADAPAITS